MESTITWSTATPYNNVSNIEWFPKLELKNPPTLGPSHFVTRMACDGIWHVQLFSTQCQFTKISLQNARSRYTWDGIDLIMAWIPWLFVTNRAHTYFDGIRQNGLRKPLCCRKKKHFLAHSGPENAPDHSNVFIEAVYIKELNIYAHSVGYGQDPGSADVK
jgi:hypothetical protein